MKYLNIILISLVVLFLSCGKGANLDMGDKSSSEGKSGSTARITIVGDYLYAVDNQSLRVIDISDPANPNHINTVDIGFGIETVFPFKNRLFIGSNFGMFISDFAHVTACDPVIANDSLAFVTLRNNEVCNRWVETRQIDVINIEDLENPYLIKSYITDEYPNGLTMTDEHVFVCMGDDGVAIYDIHKLADINSTSGAEVGAITGLNAYDAIYYMNHLFVIGESGFYQYDISDINNISLISSILKHK
jgi:hypothetical protein